MRLAAIALALTTADLASAQTIVNQIPHNGQYAGGCAYDPIQDQVWVLDADINMITAYDRSTGVLNKVLGDPFGRSVGGFVDPLSGNLWIGDEGELVYEMDQSGAVLFTFSTLPTVTDVTALTWDPVSDTLWVSDDTASILFEFTKAGGFTGNTIDVSAVSPDPDGVTFNPVSRSFFLGDDVTDSVYEVDFTGALLNSWFLGGLGITPEGLDCDAAGSLFITNGNGVIAPISVFEVTGITVAATPVAYCTAKINSLGCFPVIGFSGQPDPNSSTGFFIYAERVRSNKAGLMCYSISGRAAVPFQGGTLCLATPLLRSAPLMSGGNPANDCSGVYQIEMNAFAAGNLGGNPAPELLVAGTQVTVQFWGRDKGEPKAFSSTLSNALDYTVPIPPPSDG